MKKKWYSSKTIQFSVALAALGVSMLSVPQVQDFIAAMPPEQQGIATLIVSGVVAILRLVTSTAVTK